ncbi:membrane protease YdiL (CAAX protease family) [Lactobacillus colini]|uniref:Membrane protease YdiL (CAAX protease family) n=1 Tax=Lactobacillus colini TaxID=1819254 RepID=A0ABS4MG33_9LACO|nr:type II CAAX endopeptidase family protein [Lactobacillus colini]MBP2058322.1 membrane protease YdiL (CAAX protease family) [Lactobacillus colini]
MKRFLQVIGNVAIMILSFAGYMYLQQFYVLPQKERINFGIGATIVLVTVIIIGLISWAYKYQLRQENDWFFNSKPHWDWKRGLIAVGMFFLILVMQIIFINLFGGASSENQKALDQVQMHSNAIFNLLLVIVAPICEELIFRGMFFNTFFPEENSWSQLLGVITSGLVFAWCHDPFFSKYIFVYWMLGSILAWTYVWTKDLRYSILAHMLNNLMGLL